MLKRLTTSSIFLILLLGVSIFISGVAEANNAPTTVGTISDQALDVGGTAATVDVSGNFNDADGDNLTYTATSSDTTIATVSVSDSTVTITPVAVGTATITVTATDPGGSTVDQTFSATVTQPNRAPVAEGTIPDQVLSFGGSAVTFNAKQYFSDPDGDALTFHSITHSNDTAISITGYGNWDVKITPNAAGSATVTVVVRDPSNLEASQTFSVKVNKGPEASGTIPDGSADIGGTAHTVDVSTYFTDANNDTLTYTFETGWSTPDDIATVTLSGSTVTVTPLTSPGTATITVTATDPQDQSATQTYSVTVTQPNRAPSTVGTIPDQKLKLGGSAVAISLSQYFNDEDGDTLSYVATAANLSIVLPHVGAPGTIDLNALAVGSTSITITASDPDGLTAEQTFTARVYNGPETVGTISDATLDSGGNTHTVDLSTYFDAIDTSTLTYTVISSNTSFATVSLSDTTLTVTTVAAGTVTVTATVTDTDGLSATQTFTVTVNQANRAPVTVGTIPDQTVYINGSSATVDASQYFFDADGDKLWYTGSIYDNGTRVVVELNSVGMVTISAPNPNLQKAGTARAEIFASDGKVRVKQDINITVLPEVKPPVASGTIPDVTLAVAATSDVDVSGYFSGVSSDILTYTAVSSDTSKATTSLSGTTLTVTAVAHGTATITVTATNPISESATQSFTTTVTNPSSPVAVGTIPDSTKKAGQSAYQVQLSGYFSDPDSTTLIYTAASSDSAIASVSVTPTTSGLTITGAILSVTPLAEGTATITATATDPQLLSATQSFTMTVRQANRAPVGSTMPDIKKSSDLYIDIPLAGYFSDPDGDALTYSVEIIASPSLPISWRAGPTILTVLSSTATQTATITVTATDTDSATASESFTMTISRPPYKVGSIPAQDVVINKSITLDIASYFADPDGDTLIYSKVNSWPSIMSVSISGSTVTITGKGLGTATFAARAQDMVGGSVSFHDVSVTVSSPQPPTAVGTIPAIEGPVNQAGTTIALSGYFSDPAGQTLTYSASVSDTYYVSVSINASNELEVTPLAAGNATITVKATNPDNLSATQSISVKLTESVFHGEADPIPELTSDELSQLSALVTYDTLIFNELHNSSDDANDWLELRNVSAADLSLDDWQLSILMGDGNVVVAFPTGTGIPAGEVLLLVNTPFADTADTAMSSVAVETFALPPEEFALILQGPSGIGDLAVNYFQAETESASETAPFLTVDTVWHRNQPVVSGYLAEAWSKSTTQEGLGTPGYRHSSEAADLNNDGTVDILDLVLVASQFGMDATPTADLNADGIVNIQDLVVVANAVNGVAAAPTAQQSTVAVVNNWLHLARQSAASTVQTAIPDGFSYERGIFTLEELTRSFVPETTALLPNYPNPFNPETWIPYQLAKAADVTVRIYAADGSVVRTLVLGHQDAGMYHNRTQAAYWDGRNAVGETVASGVYFYILTAGEFAATRKMLILK